jgi:hypothetical protein
MSEALLTAQGAAAFLNMSLTGFYAWRRRHRIPSAIAGRALRFRREDLLATPNTQLPTPPIDYTELGRRHARAHDLPGHKRGGGT